MQSVKTSSDFSSTPDASLESKDTKKISEISEKSPEIPLFLLKKLA